MVFTFRNITSRRFGDGEPTQRHIASFNGISSRLVIANCRWMASTNGKATTASASLNACSTRSGKAGIYAAFTVVTAEADWPVLIAGLLGIY